MSYVNTYSIALIVAAFLIAAVISEYSLRGTDASTQGYLLNSLSAFRKAHLLGIPAILILAFFLPSIAWFFAVTYFGVTAYFAIAKIRRLELSARLRNLQAASVGVVFGGILLAAVAGYAF